MAVASVSALDRSVSAMTSSPRLVLITPENFEAACRLRVRPEQEDVVAPVVRSLAEAYVHQEQAWPRLIVDGDAVVGFLMGWFDPQNPVDAFQCGIWRLNISADHQGMGYGRFAVDAFCAEARRRGQERVTVLWVPHEHGPEAFWLGLGFRPTGEKLEGEVVGQLVLT
jgi:diamine N-acetyltransferase